MPSDQTDWTERKQPIRSHPILAPSILASGARWTETEEELPSLNLPIDCYPKQNALTIVITQTSQTKKEEPIRSSQPRINQTLM